MDNVGFVKQRAKVITNSLVYFFWNLSMFRHATVTTPIPKNGIFSYFWHICGYCIAILQDINLAFEDMKYHNMVSDWEKDLWKNIEICEFQKPKMAKSTSRGKNKFFSLATKPFVPDPLNYICGDSQWVQHLFC